MVEQFLDFLRPGKEKQFVLYDSIENIPVKLFFEILMTEKVNLLNPQGKLPKEKNLNEIWNNILEAYYKASNFREYRSILRSVKRVHALKNKINTCHASVILLKINPLNEVALDSLANFGYKNKSIDEIERLLSKELSNLKLLEKKNRKSDEKQEIDFWQLVADVEEARGFQLDIDKMPLSRWMSIVKQIKLKNEKLKKNGRRSKHKG